MPTKRQKKPVKRTVRKSTKTRPVFRVSAPPSDQKPLMSTVVETEPTQTPVPTMSVVPEEVPAETPIADSTPQSDAPEIETTPQSEPQIDQVETSESVVTEASPDEQIEPIVERVDKKSKFFLFFGIGFLFGIIAASLVLFMTNKPRPTESVNPSSSESPSAQTSPSPSPLLDKKEWIWQVQNGSGVRGAAAIAAEKLEALGFVVESSANADKSDYIGTRVYITKSSSDSAELLLKELKADFPEASISGEFVPSNESTATARLIIGK